MYLDHRVTAKITRILEQIDMSALLMDGNGTVVLPEGDNRQLANPYDPSLGYADDDDLPPVHDPWEDAAQDVDVSQLNHFDINELRARG